MAFLISVLRFVANLLVTTCWVLLCPILFILLQVTYLLGRATKQPAAVPHKPLFSGTTRPPCSIVIPNWNGKDLLEKYLPSVVSACDFNLGDEIILVDNASSDGSATWVRAHHSQVQVLSLEKNLGFGGGSNAGIQRARNPVVVLLNSDMRVEPGFLQPLLEPFREPDVFAVSAQIRFTDPNKRREESGLTYVDYEAGRFSIGHHVADIPDTVFPCFYPGGGSSAFHRELLLTLGGFDHCFRPFYLEDTDLGFEAWRRGWRVLFQPASVVYHEHRGTIGKHFSARYIQSIVAKNRLLFQWKHLHSTSALLPALFDTALQLGASCLVTESSATTVNPAALIRALAQLPGLLAARFRSAQCARHGDLQAIRLHRPDHYFDTYLHQYTRERKPRVLLVSPYPLYPPRHGGAVLITQALAFLKTHAELHLIVVLESEEERAAHWRERHAFASLHLIVRPTFHHAGRLGFAPRAAREFAIPELHHLIRRLVLQKQIDIVQLEYTQMAQYAQRYQHVVTSLFEHDVYFQSVARRLFTKGASASLSTVLEYLRALRFELRALQKVDYVQVCTSDNAQLLRAHLPGMSHRIDANLRAGIHLREYSYAVEDRDKDTLLFVGNFRHTPNREGLDWLVNRVMPEILRRHPQVRLLVVGANSHLLPFSQQQPSWLDLVGEVQEVQPYLRKCTLFVCPVMTGSGVRVKLLEAYASGIPVVSTTIGAEGLHGAEQPFCLLADTPQSFADAVCSVLEDPTQVNQLVPRARAFVETYWDAEGNAHKVVERYRELLLQKQQALIC